VKFVTLVAEPEGFVTRIGPVVAPLGTVARSFVLFVIENVATTLLNVTELTPVKFVPLTVTDVPTGPEVGENEEIAGAPAVGTVKFVALVAVPTSVVTRIGPVVAPVGTVVVT
jgi:hypothetical protein